MPARTVEPFDGGLRHLAHFSMKTISILLILCAGASAQPALSLKDAVHLALARNPSMAAAAADRGAAENRIAQARGARLPKVDYAESWTRSDNPVFVFSSLLTEHQFEAQNFQLGALNRPGFLNNFQSLLTAGQTLYDGGRASHAIRSAEIGRNLAGEDAQLTQTGIVATVAQSYYAALLAAEQLKAATQAERSAQADLDRAREVRAAGMSTDADVLSIRVHLAGVSEQKIRRAADLDVARAALNQAIGLPLDTTHELTTRLTRASVAVLSPADYEGAAVSQRPEARESKLAADLAGSRLAEARAALLPEITLRGALEADRQRFYNRGGANWTVSLAMRWNLFDGRSNRARIAESQSLLAGASARQEKVAGGIRLQVRRAYADLRAAEQRIEVAQASVDEAEESLRIVQNRYAAGMTTVTDLLRTETAALDARTHYLAAIHDQRVAAVALEFAAGKLTADAEVLN